MSRAARQPADRTRRQMLDVAVRKISAEGLELDFANLNLEELIREAAVPRSTVFRIWADRTAFVADLIDALFEAHPQIGQGFDEETARVVTSTIGDNAELMRTREGRRVVLREAVRLAAAHNVRAVAASVPWTVYRSVLSAARSGAETFRNPALMDRLRAVEERFLSRTEGLYAAWAEVFGRRFIPGVTARDLAVCGASLVEGIAERRTLLDTDAARPVTLPGEDPEEWEAGALAFYSILTTFTEELPDEG